MPAVISVCISRQGGRGTEGALLLGAAGGGDRRKHSLNKEGESGEETKKEITLLPARDCVHTYYFSVLSLSILARSLTPPPMLTTLLQPFPLPVHYPSLIRESRKGASGTVFPVVPSLHSSIIFLAFVLFLFGGSHDTIIDIFIW